jgi:hypothetical protein
MGQTAERLSEKLHTLSSAQLAEVERFVEALQAWERDRETTRILAHSSQPAFEAVWSNPEDEVYDDL